MDNWYTRSKEEVLTALNTSAKGLSDEEAEARREKYGSNSLAEKKQRSPFKLLFQQFTETMVLILILQTPPIRRLRKAYQLLL